MLERLCGGCHRWLVWSLDLFYRKRPRIVGHNSGLDEWCKACRRNNAQIYGPRRCTKPVAPALTLEAARLRWAKR